MDRPKAYRDERDGDRYDMKRAAGITYTAIAPPVSGRENDIMATAVERMVADALGVPLLDSEAHLHGDPGYDMPYRGWRADAKWTPKHHHRLILPVGKKKVADIYVLVTGPTVEDLVIRGWATYAELTARTMNLVVPSYARDQRDLHPFETLLNIVPRTA